MFLPHYSHVTMVCYMENTVFHPDRREYDKYSTNQVRKKGSQSSIVFINIFH